MVRVSLGYASKAQDCYSMVFCLWVTSVVFCSNSAPIFYKDMYWCLSKLCMKMATASSCYSAFTMIWKDGIDSSSSFSLVRQLINGNRFQYRNTFGSQLYKTKQGFYLRCKVFTLMLNFKKTYHWRVWEGLPEIIKIPTPTSTIKHWIKPKLFSHRIR